MAATTEFQHPATAASRRSRAPAALFAQCALSALFAGAALAQPAPTLPEVRVESRAEDPATERVSVGGFGDGPAARTPQSLSVTRAATLRELGASGLSSALRSEPSAGDAYNTTGYVESLQVRGFLLDNALNFRRDGMAVSNHAPMALENKESIELLKGVSGIQNGLSAPGGLVNSTLKRPTSSPLREVSVSLSERGTRAVHADFGGRAGEGRGLGYRINLAGESRHPHADNAPGDRRFLSGFFDYKLPGGTLLEAEFEHHRVRQRSVPGFGLLDMDGDGVAETLPAPIDPRINLNAQPWSLPFESTANAGSIRLQQALSTRWLWGLRAGVQRIRTDDRLAFPDGCSSGPNYLYPGFCGNFDFDVYDFRSDNERRETRTLEAFVRGDADLGGLRHEIAATARRVRYSERFPERQAYNWVGIGNVFAPVALPADPVARDLNTQLDATSDEIAFTDTIRLGERWSLWLGLRHTRLERASERTDGSRAVRYAQSFTSPWLALGARPWAGGFAYLSAGDGIESEAVPNRPSLFSNAGEVLVALRSRQFEAGFRQTLPGAGLFAATLFQIDKPYSDDEFQPDGRALRVAGAREARHRGLELSWAGRPARALALSAGATLLDARTTRAIDQELIGRRVTNAAPFAASLLATWSIPGVEGLVWTNRAVFSDRKPVTRDNAIELASYWQFDTALSYTERRGSSVLTWRLGIDNVFDRRYWREAPTQYWGGVYLFPAQPRSLRASLRVAY
ncbi:MAG: TonB-dependent siderophore receptor [Burkholderiaceae bacterium]|nr:TonB-dependent siderophore receptor [Burkholderiaceae bacterium]